MKTKEVESWEGKPNSIKFPYFADTTKRGVRVWKEAQRQGEFTEGMLKSGMSNEILDQIAREVLSEVQGKSHWV
jgi:hypothetical protein